MSDYSKEQMIKKVNEELDLPFVPEGLEEKGIRWVVDKIFPAIPDWALPLLYDSLDGVDETELGSLEDSLVKVVNEKVDLPYVPESLEETLIRPVINALLSFAVKGKSLSE